MLQAHLDDRIDRLHGNSKDPGEFRTEFERDHDRILYSSAFRRLAGVTQIVNPSEGQVFHNRLTHSLKVAQIGRRISKKIRKKYSKKVLDYWGGLDPNVVEAAALAHDLGNPPFGHMAEKVLDILVRDALVEDGFEGNAQSFRVVNKLAMMYRGNDGLNLTAATLNAILKYPWHRKSPEENKFGYYQDEAEEFKLVRGICSHLNEVKTLEAAIMDISDNISYAIHDFEDIYHANLISFELLKTIKDSKDLKNKIQEYRNESWFLEDDIDTDKEINEFWKFLYSFPLKTSYQGGLRERTVLHDLSSSLIKRFINGIKVNEDFSCTKSPIFLSSDVGVDIFILKYIAKYFGIDQPCLIRQQHGEKTIIETLFTIFMDAIKENKNNKEWEYKWKKIFPISFQQRLTLIEDQKPVDIVEKKVRIVADTISFLTDSEAIRIYSRLTGTAPGSIFDFLVS